MPTVPGRSTVALPPYGLVSTVASATSRPTACRTSRAASRTTSSATSGGTEGWGAGEAGVPATGGATAAPPLPETEPGPEDVAQPELLLPSELTATSGPPPQGDQVQACPAEPETVSWPLRQPSPTRTGAGEPSARARAATTPSSAGPFERV